MILRLYFIAENHWAMIDAEYVNTNLIKLPMHRFLNCIYKWCVDRTPPDKLEMFEMQLNEPLEGDEPSEMTEEMEGSAFMSAMMTLQKG